MNVDILPDKRFRLEGNDLYTSLPVTPWEAALGETVSVPTLGGSVEMKLPVGAKAGQKLRLKGRGLPGSPGRRPGCAIVYNDCRCRGGAPQGGRSRLGLRGSAFSLKTDPLVSFAR